MSKTFEEYAWHDLMESGDLKKLLVNELKKKIRRILLHVLRGEDGQQEDINESTDKEAKEHGTEDDSKEINSSGDDESENNKLSLQNCQVGLPQSMKRLLANRNIIASNKVIR